MNEFLSTLLQAVLIAAVPVCAGGVIKVVQAVVEFLSTKVKNELAKKYLGEAADAIEKAVSHTNQTYVDVLKKSEKFTAENQAEARQKSLDKALELLTEEAQRFLEEAYGDLNAYLLSRIEPEVRRQKKSDAESIALGSITAVAPVETSDVATVAAATAAATAATVAQTAIAQVASVFDDSAPDDSSEEDGDAETSVDTDADGINPPEHVPAAEMEHQFFFGVPGVDE